MELLKELDELYAEIERPISHVSDENPRWIFHRKIHAAYPLLSAEIRRLALGEKFACESFADQLGKNFLLQERLRELESTPIAEQMAKKVETIRRLEAELVGVRKDAERYRWLRDESVPPHNFYLSVPIEFGEQQYSPHEVDAYIDKAMGQP